MHDYLDLADWRRWVSELYGNVRRESDPMDAWHLWCRGRDVLFSRHPQSPIPADRRGSYAGVPTFDHDPAWRTTGRLDRIEPRRVGLVAHDGGETALLLLGTVHFTIAEAAHTLPLYWMDDYAGGLFLPFRDATNGDTTYGGGRYLLDTAKGADLGTVADALILDFNFAYHPSCAHDSQWSCPLAMGEAFLPVAVTAGEQLA
jgi:uncharacterized protein (DUF1684 family)